MSDADSRRNMILAALPGADRQALLEPSALVTLPAGHTLQFPGEPYSAVFFPTYGVVSAVSTLRGGHNVEIAAVGTDGVVGVGPILGLHHATLWYLVQIGAAGYTVPVEVFTPMFHRSASLRELILAHLGRLLSELARSASCNRFHSHRERLARWLVITMRKAGVLSLPLTHDSIAQMVGGPRHAVTEALQELRERGAIDYQRGLTVIVDEEKLLAAACECVGSAIATQV